MGQKLCCKKDDGDYLPGWDVNKREDGEWMETIERKSRASDAPGRKRNSGRDRAKEGVSPKRPSEEWAGWLDVIDNLNKLDVDDLDDAPCPDKEIEAAVNKGDFSRVGLGVLSDAVKGFLTTSMGSLYSNDSVLMALKEEIGEDSSVMSDLSFDGDAAQKQAGSNPQSGNARPEKLGDGALSPRDLARLIKRMKGAGEVAKLISRMKSASEEARLDSANWDDSADWGDADLVAPRPSEDKNWDNRAHWGDAVLRMAEDKRKGINREAHINKRMSDIAEDQEKSWEGGVGIPSENSAEGGEGEGPRAADGNDSTSLLMDQMEQLGDEPLGEELPSKMDGGEDSGEAGGRREGPRRTRRDTAALFQRMDTLNSEFAAEMDNIHRLTS